MSIEQICLTESEKTKPRLAYIPYQQAISWVSPVQKRGLNPSVSVFVTQRAYVRFCAHAGSDLENEVGGWLIGKWRADKSTGEQFVVVERILPAQHIRHGSAFLTFTHDSQVALYNEFEDRYPDKDLIGWYHTHPRMGIFFSDYDAWLHLNFFPELWQVALVIEPHSITGGFFIRQKDGALDQKRYFGFYELTNRQKRSIVHWRNVSTDNESIPSQGE